MKIKVNDQIVYRKQQPMGRDTIVKVGTVLTIDAKGTATCSFPADRTKAKIPISELETVREVYGRDRVEIDPTRRSIVPLKKF